MADDESLTIRIDEGADEGNLDPAEELKRQFDALKAENEKERAAKDAAEARASQARRDAEAARTEASAARQNASDSELATVTGGIAAAQGEADAAQRDYEIAAEAGDWKKMGEAQRRMSRAESRLTALEGAKSDLEARKDAKPPPARDSRPDDPFEEHVSKHSPRSAQWMREHKEWVTDPRKSAKLTAAHWNALGDGLTADTDEYFEHVEKALKIRGEPDSKPNGGDSGSRPRARTPVVAPVNGGAGAHTSGAGDNRGVTVTLSRSEESMAKSGAIVWNKGDRDAKGNVIKEGDDRLGKPIGVSEYARRKHEMNK